MAVGAAGIMVELGLAALAFFVWQASTEPRVQQAALAVMLLCGLSTLLFNANPLVRFDGYFTCSVGRAGACPTWRRAPAPR